MDDTHSSRAAAPSQGEEPPWDAFAERIDAFAAAWDAAAAAEDEPPRLDDFLLELDQSAARQLAAELAKLDIERRWEQNRQPQHIEWYAQQYPLLSPIAKLPV